MSILDKANLVPDQFWHRVGDQIAFFDRFIGQWTTYMVDENGYQVSHAEYYDSKAEFRTAEKNGGIGIRKWARTAFDMDHSKLMIELEEMLETTPRETAKILGTPYPTYMKWRQGTRSMPAIGLRCVQLVMQMHRMGHLVLDPEDE